MKRWVRGIILLALVVVLSACNGMGGIKASVVERAIALNIVQVQQDLNQQLYKTAQPLPKIQVSHVNLTQRNALPIQGLEGYRVQGTYDLALTYNDHTVRQQNNSFELYLQKQGKEAWALARPFSPPTAPLTREDLSGGDLEPQWTIWPLQTPPSSDSPTQSAPVPPEATAQPDEASSA